MSILSGEISARVDAACRAALVGECQAVDCYAELRAHFEQRNLAFASATCRNLLTKHEHAIALLADAGVERSSARPWLDPRAREFLLRAARPRLLLEAAVAIERDLLRGYEDMQRSSREETIARELSDRLASMTFDNVRRLDQAMDSLPARVDWEQLVASGTVPALVLGAERRLRR